MILKKGRIGMNEYLRCRVRYFSDGVAIGHRGFVDGIFQKFRGHFGLKRKNSARRMRGLEFILTHNYCCQAQECASID